MSGDYFADSGVATLLPHHQKMICDSAVSDAVRLARGYRSVRTKVELRKLGFNEAQSHCVPALILPTFRPDGQPGIAQMRPDTPRQFPDGRTAKYEMPSKERLCLDVPPTVRKDIGNPKVPLFITEGIRKGDALASIGCCVIALLGVTCWRGTNEFDGKTALPDWNDVALNGREVYIVFDSDVMRKSSVYYALRAVHAYLVRKGANVFFVYLPTGEGGTKVGVDDYLAAGHGLDDLMRLATSTLLPMADESEEEQNSGPYRETERGIVWNKPTKDGDVPTPLTNFLARIVADVHADDGAEVVHEYRIEAKRGKRTLTFTVPTVGFDALNWPSEFLGVSAYVFPGMGIKDHARVAIRDLSGDPPETRVYTHIGWREIDGVWGYLHADGCIGVSGAVQVRLSGNLQRYRLPEAPTESNLQKAIRASLHLLTLADARITVPIFAAIYRAALLNADFSLSLAGPSGAFKSEIAALAQQHYGQAMDANHLPAAWSSTDNALEDLAFRVKDALMVIDDFAPTPGDALRLHTKADRVLRAQGNGSGRQRMRSDGTLRPERPPRGLILSTGEDVPQGKSLKARQFIVEIGPGEIDKERLTVCQRDARSGLYAEAMAGFLAHMAPNYGANVATFQEGREKYRAELSEGCSHLRTPEITADLAMGLDWFLKFALESGAISAEQFNQVRTSGWAALRQAAQAQSIHQFASDPARRFIDLLRSAISSERAHLADKQGFHPDDAMAWGWRSRIIGAGEHERQEWQPQGECIGYVDGDDLYLIPDSAYNVVKRIGAEGGEGIALATTTLFKRLNEARLLRSTDTTRKTLQIRRTLEGKQQNVLHLATASLLSVETDISDKPDTQDSGWK